MSYTKDQMTAKQQMIVVCEGMLQLLEPNELSMVMEDIAKRVRVRLSPESSEKSKTSGVSEEINIGESRDSRGRKIWVRGVRYATVAEACRKHGITETSVIGSIRKDIRDGVSTEDIFPPIESVNKVSVTMDVNDDGMTKSDQVAMGG